MGYLDKQVLRPNYFNEFENVKALQETKEGKDPDQQKLFNLSKHSGWKVLKERIERIMDELDNLTKTQMTQGVSFEEIGRSTVIKELSKDVIRRIIQIVEDSRESGEGE